MRTYVVTVELPGPCSDDQLERFMMAFPAFAVVHHDAGCEELSANLSASNPGEALDVFERALAEVFPGVPAEDATVELGGEPA